MRFNRIRGARGVAAVAMAAAGLMLGAAPAAAEYHPPTASTGAAGECDFTGGGTLDTDTGALTSPSGDRTFASTATEPRSMGSR